MPVMPALFLTELHCNVDGAWTRCEPTLHPPRQHIDLSMYAAQIDAFVDAVLTGKKVPCDGRQGLRNVARLAAATNRPARANRSHIPESEREPSFFLAKREVRIDSEG